MELIKPIELIKLTSELTNFPAPSPYHLIPNLYHVLSFPLPRFRTFPLHCFPTIALPGNCTIIIMQTKERLIPEIISDEDTFC